MTEIPGLKRSERLAACSNAACSAAIPTVSAPGVAVYVPDAPTKLWAQERTRTQGTARIEQEENYRSLASISILYSISIYIFYLYLYLGELSGGALWESSLGELSQRALWGALWESSLQSMNQINEPNQSLKSEHCPKEAFWTMVIFRINEPNESSISRP